MRTLWKERKIPERSDPELCSLIEESCGVSKITAEVLMKRGCESPESAMAYLEPQWDDLHDPYLLPDMQAAVERLIAARERGEKLCIYGDYDADGTTAAAILLKYFNSIGLRATYRFPNRLKEGYGMNIPALTEVIADGVDLILTVDNGISALKEADFCAEQGVDLIVTDHHECQENLPQAVAVIDAKRQDSQYPFSELCGAGIAFKLIQALEAHLNTGIFPDEYLECTALATVADVVPLKDENRTIVSLGLQSLNDSPINRGLRALIDVSELSQVTAGNIGFQLAPKINAAGRLGDAAKVLDLYLAKNDAEAEAAAQYLKTENEKRQKIEADIYAMAEQTIRDEHLDQNDFLIVSGSDWHSGVIGIVAGKLQESRYRPTIVIGLDENGIGKGSCRSVPGVDIFEALSSCRELFINYGGHEQAAGFSIEEKNIPALRSALADWGKAHHVSEKCVKVLHYDATISREDIEFGILSELEQCEPCGIGNPSPVFKMDIPLADEVRCIGKEQHHLSFLTDGVRCIGFNMADYCDAVKAGNFETLCRLKGNDYQGRISVQLQLIDIHGNDLMDNRQCWQWIQHLRKAEDIESDSVLKGLLLHSENELIPERDKMAAVYQFFSVEKISSIPFNVMRDQIAQMNSFQLLLTLFIFNEWHFLDFRIKDGVIIGQKCKNNEKKDIKKAPLVVKLIKSKEKR